MRVCASMRIGKNGRMANPSTVPLKTWCLYRHDHEKNNDKNYDRNCDDGNDDAENDDDDDIVIRVGQHSHPGNQQMELNKLISVSHFAFNHDDDDHDHDHCFSIIIIIIMTVMTTFTSFTGQCHTSFILR